MKPERIGSDLVPRLPLNAVHIPANVPEKPMTSTLTAGPLSPTWSQVGIRAHMSDPMAVSRRLVAVFAADVEGYSRLMGADEVGTLKGLTERRVILDRIIGEHRGRIANTAGDSVLAEYGSTVDAVQCAVETQTALAEANSNKHQNAAFAFASGSTSATSWYALETCSATE